MHSQVIHFSTSKKSTADQIQPSRQNTYTQTSLFRLIPSYKWHGKPSHWETWQNSKQTMNSYGSFVCAGIILFKCIVLSCMCNYQRLCSVLYKQYYIYMQVSFLLSLSLSLVLCVCVWSCLSQVFFCWYCTVKVLYTFSLFCFYNLSQSKNPGYTPHTYTLDHDSVDHLQPLQVTSLGRTLLVVLVLQAKSSGSFCVHPDQKLKKANYYTHCTSWGFL